LLSAEDLINEEKDNYAYNIIHVKQRLLLGSMVRAKMEAKNQNYATARKVKQSEYKKLQFPRNLAKDQLPTAFR
jgi:hypothetical protein